MDGLRDEHRDPVEARSAIRVPFSAAVQFRSGTRRATVRVLDISIKGARVSTVHPMRSGERFYIKLPLIEALEGEVMWCDQFEVGCKFLRPLHPAVLEQILRCS